MPVIRGITVHVIYLENQRVIVPYRTLAAHATDVRQKLKRNDESLEAMTADPARPLPEDAPDGFLPLLLTIRATRSPRQNQSEGGCG